MQLLVGTRRAVWKISIVPARQLGQVGGAAGAFNVVVRSFGWAAGRAQTTRGVGTGMMNLPPAAR